MVSPIYTVRLERVFQGPLDLLLHLVREQEVEIHEIEINRILSGYLEYLKTLRDLDIELAGEFLVMAATLMSIKSRSLLPREKVDLAEEIDPRDELIQRLIEYRRFKEASDRLGTGYELRLQQHSRGACGLERAEQAETELDLGELTSWDLLAAFSKLMRETLADRPHRVTVDHRPLRFYVESLAGFVRAHPRQTLREALLAAAETPTREALIGTFCALLELVKLGIVGVAQDSPRSDIAILLREEHEADMEQVLASSVFDDEAPLPAGTPAQSADAAPDAARGLETAFELDEEDPEARSV